MMRKFKAVALVCAALFAACSGTVSAQSGALDAPEAEAVEFMYLFAELKQDYFEKGNDRWSRSVLISFAAEEQRHMDALGSIAADYQVEISIYYWGCNTLFWEYEELDFYCGLIGPDVGWWDNWEAYLSTAAYFEELGIRELQQAVEITDEQLIIDTYAEMLDVAYAHLLHFASKLHDDPFDYEAQLLSQATVDLALAEALSGPAEDFVINSGLNDAWYDPTLDGQGFTISVFEDKGTVFLAWFTFDTEPPASSATANLGDPGQRWLTAQGAYEGRQAELVVYSPSGGLFNASPPVPELDPIGSMILEFEDCYTATISYELPGIERSGSIPIRRVATDNLCNCAGAGQRTR
jgi:hypothetical protein